MENAALQELVAGVQRLTASAHRLRMTLVKVIILVPNSAYFVECQVVYGVAVLFCEKNIELPVCVGFS